MVKKTENSFPRRKVIKGAWTEEEDRKLAEYVKIHGDKKWRSLPANAGLNRCGKSCRLRWMNYLRPGIKRGNISEDEEDLIIRLHNLIGNRWSLIAGRLPGRTDNEIKNHWNTHLSKKALTNNELNLRSYRKLDFNGVLTSSSSQSATISAFETTAPCSPKPDTGMRCSHSPADHNPWNIELPEEQLDLEIDSLLGFADGEICFPDQQEGMVQKSVEDENLLREYSNGFLLDEEMMMVQSQIDYEALTGLLNEDSSLNFLNFG